MLFDQTKKYIAEAFKDDKSIYIQFNDKFISVKENNGTRFSHGAFYVIINVTYHSYSAVYLTNYPPILNF